MPGHKRSMAHAFEGLVRGLATPLVAFLVACGGGSPSPVEHSVDTGAPPGPSTPESATPGPAAVPAIQLFASGFEPPVSIPSTNRRGNVVQPMQNGDVGTFDWLAPLWGESGSAAIGIHSIVGDSTPLPASSYSRAQIREVTGRDGQPTHALSLANFNQSPATTVQQIALRRVGMTVEPLFYQRMWVKFDPETLVRAGNLGERDFYQIFWEVKAEPDYRIRLQLQYDADTGLYWQAQADALLDSRSFWSSVLTSVPVVLADEGSAQGWHKLEVWLDRPANRFRAAIDGIGLVDRTGTLMGASGNPINILLTMIVYSGVAPLAEVLFDDLGIWEAPVADAWR